MADETPGIFNADATTRIRQTVRTVEGWPRDVTGRKTYLPTNGSTVLWVQLTGKCDGAGKYTGRVFHPYEGDIIGSSALADYELGSTNSDEDELIVMNVREVGKGTWDLWDGTAEGDNQSLLPTTFMGTVRQQNNVGKIVVMIDGWKRFDCGATP
jgi:hypothetical protein